MMRFSEPGMQMQNRDADGDRESCSAGLVVEGFYVMILVPCARTRAIFFLLCSSTLLVCPLAVSCSGDRSFLLG